MLCELPAGANWNFDVAWSTKIPGVLSTSSFDGKVSIYNIEVRPGTTTAVCPGTMSLGQGQAPRPCEKQTGLLARTVCVTCAHGGAGCQCASPGACCVLPLFCLQSASKAAVSDSDFGAAISNQVPIGMYSSTYVRFKKLEGRLFCF